MDLLAAVLGQSHLPMLLIIGFAIVFGTIGARLFQRLRIPQVVGYIVIGLLVGQSGLGLVNSETVRNLAPFNFFALGVIGFMIGGELHRDVFKKHGRQFFAILFAEGMGAFILVSLFVGCVAMLVTGKMLTSVALGLVFGAISSATAPAATVNVLWEYKARGVLTRAIYAIVALDDALALVLFSIAASIAVRLTGQTDGGMFGSLSHAAYELLGGALLGVGTGAGLNFVLRRTRDYDKALPFVIGTMLLVVGLGRLIGVDVILAAMAMGATLRNVAPRRSRRVFEIVERFAPPVYVLFFVLAGAHLDVWGMPAWMWALALPYLIGRSAGKILGANLCGRLVGAAAVLRKYLGWCLFSQGGVAIGLSIIASQRFTGELGMAIIMIVTVTTFIVEVLGPPCVKYAVKKAGEIGLNVTEEDLMNSYSVGDMMDRQSPSFRENATLGNILHTIAETDSMSYPVTDAEGNLTGCITIQDLKRSFSAEGLTDWLVAFDLMQPSPDVATEDMPLSEAVTQMREQELDYLPVVADRDAPRLVGLLELRAVNRRLSKEVLRRHQLAEAG